MATKKQRRYKSPKTILRKLLEFFRANPYNWTAGQLHVKNAYADGGVAHCAIGGCLAFAENRKLSNTAIRYLAEAMGMENARTAKIGDVKDFVISRNDGILGSAKVLSGLEKATG